MEKEKLKKSFLGRVLSSDGLSPFADCENGSCQISCTLGCSVECYAGCMSECSSTCTTRCYAPGKNISENE